MLCCEQDQQNTAPFYQRIAVHYQQAGNWDEAERFYIKAGAARKVSYDLIGSGALSSLALQ